MSKTRLLRGLFSGVCMLGLLDMGQAAESPGGSPRPSPAQACSAWREHIDLLIDEHRVVGDLDEDSLFTVIQQFVAAQATCSAARFDEGLRIYEWTQLGRARGALQ